MMAAKAESIFIQLKVSVYLRTIQEKGIGSMLPGSPSKRSTVLWTANMQSAAKRGIIGCFSQEQRSSDIYPKGRELINLGLHIF